MILPKSAEQPSAARRAVIAAGEKFALHSGGHAPLSGADDIRDGVILDLTLLGGVQFDEDSKTVSFGPGVSIETRLRGNWRNTATRRTATEKSKPASPACYSVGVPSSWMTGRGGIFLRQRRPVRSYAG